MVFKRFYLGCLAHASYLVGDERSGVAAVVDPQRDIDEYLQEAARRKLTIGHVVLTHFHADFVAGHLELRRRTGATIHLGAKAKASYPFARLADGDELKLGPSVRLRALETPGHTPEGITVLVFDASAKAQPWAALTGDTLFIGDVGRPDLMASAGVSARQLASKLYDSLRNKLMTLPEATLVYPAHGAGSLCGRALSTEPFSTIGQQKRFNYALKDMSRAEFIDLVARDQPEAPAYFSRDAKLNRSAVRPTLEETLERGLRPLSHKQVLAAARRGAQLLDTRDPSDFAAGHLPGSLNVGLGGKFATFAGLLVGAGKPIVVIAAPGRERESALRLGRVGFDRLAGYLEGGIAAAHASGAPLAAFPRLSASQLAERLAGAARPVVLDVRNPAERKASAIPGSLHVPLAELSRRLKDVPRKPLVVTCAGGYRSAMAVSLLLKRGRKNLADLDGGMAAWLEHAGKPVAACAKSIAR